MCVCVYISRVVYRELEVETGQRTQGADLSLTLMSKSKKNRAGCAKVHLKETQHMNKPDFGNELLIIIFTLFRMQRSGANVNKIVSKEEEH